MSGNPLLLIAANALDLAVGVGIVLALGLAEHRRAMLARLGLAYGIGLAAVGILGANLALAGVVLGLPALAGLAAASLALGLHFRRRRDTPPDAAPARSLGDLFGLAAAVPIVALLAVAATAFLVHPLEEWDGWAIWALKAQALYDFGGATGPVLTSAVYSQASYPILLPALEATDYRAMGTPDTVVLHLQLLLLAVAFAGSLFGLLWRRVPNELIAAAILAILSAPQVLGQLETAYADIPLAFFAALGLVALVRWLADREGAMLAVATVFLGAAALTKNEGSLFAVAALGPVLAVTVVAERARLRALGAAVAALVVAALPWRVFTAEHHLAVGAVSLSDAVRPSLLAAHASRLAPATQSLFHQIWTSGWGYLGFVTALALISAVLSGRLLLASFTVAWLLLSFAGLVATYWLSSLPFAWYVNTSAYRVVDTLIVGGAALTPLLAADSWRAVTAYGFRRRVRLQAPLDALPQPVE